MARLAKGRILRLAVSAAQIETKRYGGVDAVDAAATWEEATGRVAVFVANRSLDESSDLTIDLHGLGDLRVVEAETLTIPEGGDRHTSNLETAPDSVHMVPLGAVEVVDGAVRATLPPLSWSVIQLEVARA
jgi:alpha-N-arabinofuranosidase